MFKSLTNYYSPPETVPTSVIGDKTPTNVGTPKGMGKEDIIDFLSDDDKPEVIDLNKPIKSDKPEKEIKEPKDEEIIDDEPDDNEEPDELSLLEDELTEPTEEQLELTTPVRRAEILKKYPTLFKDFPYLEKAYYREQQFTEIFPTIQDAKTAVDNNETLASFEKDLESGNTEVILKAVKASNPKAFAKIADDYMTTLMKVDEGAYHHVLGNTIKHTIVAMVEEARRSENDGLRAAASLLNQFVFGTSEFKAPARLTVNEPENKSDDDKVSDREKQFIERAFETSKGELNTKVNNVLKSTISQNIDPKESMTEYVRKNATRDAVEVLEGLIKKDSRFTVIIDKLWQQAEKTNFSAASIDTIKRAYLSKAKTLLPAVIKKARNEALKGMGKRVRDDDDEVVTEEKESTPARRSKPKDEPSSNRSGKIKSAKDIPAGMRSIDFLMQD